MEEIKIRNLFNLEETIAKDLLISKVYPWEVLTDIGCFIISLGKTLPVNEFDNPKENVWISKSAKVYESAYISGPCIIDQQAEIRHCAFIRGNAIVGKNCVVGNSTELKNVILFNKVQVPHYNYIGDSILGYCSHLGAGAITSNVKSDKKLVNIKGENFIIKTNLKKVGAMIGDNVEIGCNSVLCPGTIIGRNSSIYPLSMVRGIIKENEIFKNKNEKINKIF